MLDQILKAIKRTERSVAIANATVRAVHAVTPVSDPTWDEMWRRWNNVPLSDRRGQHRAMLIEMEVGFEKKLDPWKRWFVKSNGRCWIPASRQRVRAIRGIHIRTMGTKDYSHEPCLLAIRVLSRRQRLLRARDADRYGADRMMSGTDRDGVKHG